MTVRPAVVTHPFTINFVQIKAGQLCRRSDFSRSDSEELQQGMVLYLWKKAHLFDPARGNIEAFVTNALTSWVGMELRRRSRLKRRCDYQAISLERTTIECDGDTDSLDSVISESDQERRTQRSGLSPIEMIALREALTHGMGRLSARDRELLLHVAEHGVASAARKSRVSRRQIENAIARMRSRFEDAGLGDD
jgi:hypothetical protein